MAFAAPLLSARLTSTRSSCFAVVKESMPGSAAAIFLNSACTPEETVRRQTPLILQMACRSPCHVITAAGILQWRPRLQDTQRQAEHINWFAHLDVEPCLCAGLDEDDTQVARLGIALLDGHLPAIGEKYVHVFQYQSASSCTTDPHNCTMLPSCRHKHSCRRWLPCQACITHGGLALARLHFDTHRLSTRSVLLPTSTMITSLPRSFRTSSIHRSVFRNDCRSAE